MWADDVPTSGRDPTEIWGRKFEAVVYGAGRRLRDLWYRRPIRRWQKQARMAKLVIPRHRQDFGQSGFDWRRATNMQHVSETPNHCGRTHRTKLKYTEN